MPGLQIRSVCDRISTHTVYRSLLPAHSVPPKLKLPFPLPVKSSSVRAFTEGEVAEWPIAAVLKTAVPQGTGGSNPSLSATNARRLIRLRGYAPATLRVYPLRFR